MKKKKLEIFLQQTPGYITPNPSLEQYQTPAVIAADIVYFAYQNKDIEGKTVADLGCGTGIFSFGASLLKAKKVFGIDKDIESIMIAKSFAQKHHLPITFMVKDISEIHFTVDTVIMNPPFGAQKSNIHADQVFLKKALEISSTIYSIHLTKTMPHLKKFLNSNNAYIDEELKGAFPLKAQFTFHKKIIEHVPVSILKINHLPVED